MMVMVCMPGVGAGLDWVPAAGLDWLGGIGLHLPRDRTVVTIWPLRSRICAIGLCAGRLGRDHDHRLAAQRIVGEQRPSAEEDDK